MTTETPTTQGSPAHHSRAGLTGSQIRLCSQPPLFSRVHSMQQCPLLSLPVCTPGCKLMPKSLTVKPVPPPRCHKTTSLRERLPKSALSYSNPNSKCQHCQFTNATVHSECHGVSVQQCFCIFLALCKESPSF